MHTSTPFPSFSVFWPLENKQKNSPVSLSVFSPLEGENKHTGRQKQGFPPRPDEGSRYLRSLAANYAREVKVEALRQLGVMLKETPRAAARFDEGNKKEPSLNTAPTLAELGLDKKTSSLPCKTTTYMDGM